MAGIRIGLISDGNVDTFLLDLRLGIKVRRLTKRPRAARDHEVIGIDRRRPIRFLS